MNRDPMRTQNAKKVLTKDQVLKIRTLLKAVLLKEDGILWISFYRSAKSTFSANKRSVLNSAPTVPHSLSLWWEGVNLLDCVIMPEDGVYTSLTSTLHNVQLHLSSTKLWNWTKANYADCWIRFDLPRNWWWNVYFRFVILIIDQRVQWKRRVKFTWYFNLNGSEWEVDSCATFYKT